jgi:hypothetical protein
MSKFSRRSGKRLRAPYGDGALAYLLRPTFGRVEGRLRPGSAMRLAGGPSDGFPCSSECGHPGGAVSNPQVGDCACRKAWPSREHVPRLHTQPIRPQLKIQF